MAQKLDPTCALCFWGEALVLGPNINVPMMPAPPLGRASGARRAGRRRQREAERALIAALAALFRTRRSTRAARRRSAADAMAALS